MDIDYVGDDDFRVCQLTPPGSGCPVIIGSGVTAAEPGSLQVEASKVHPQEDGSPPPVYRLVDLYFADYDAASAAVATPEAAAFFPSTVELAAGGVRIVFAQVQPA